MVTQKENQAKYIYEQREEIIKRLGYKKARRKAKLMFWSSVGSIVIIVILINFVEKIIK